MATASTYTTQNSLLLQKLIAFYKENNYLDVILPIINGEGKMSLRLIDWFVTNYAKKNFDPFCRWERITIPYDDDNYIQTTIGQLNFFKWVLENEILTYLEENFETIEKDMNRRNSTSKRKEKSNKKTRKKREELSISASKSIKKEKVEIIVKFN